MAVYKCKMCSGELDVNESVTVIECDYCGTKQTVPKAKDENLQGLFNRANTLRKKSDFDKSEQIYEKILQNDSTQAEAYWGLILCKYGIEYVEDPQTFKRIPTCHRTSYDSIIADDDYKSAINNADAVQRSIYESEAKEIDRIQKEIISLSQKEEPYDVFICYKETDETGKRTQDSVIANDIYYQLTKEGFKVFYAAITLEDKLGSAYEPCIFAALNSSKVMLAVGTKPEYFNAVWVRNEWSRFLRMMKKNRNKILIPCYKDMDAYELPEEFAHLQAQDMSKIGFINDIIRGVSKLIGKQGVTVTTPAPIQQTAVSVSDADTAPLLERMFIFLEDGDWQSADEYAEKVLDRDPKNAVAYLGKLMVALNVKKRSGLVSLSETFENRPEYLKIQRFGDDGIRRELDECLRSIKERNTEKAYLAAVSAMKRASATSAFGEAAKMFARMNGYKDSAELEKQCRSKAGECAKNDTYNTALRKMNSGKNADCKEALNLFKSLKDWKDSAKQILICEAKINDLEAKVKDNLILEQEISTRKNKIKSLQNSIKKLENDISYLILERTANHGCSGGLFILLGMIFLIVEIIMGFDTDTMSFTLIPAGLCYFIGILLLSSRTPKKSVIKINYALKAKWEQEIRDAESEVAELRREISEIQKNIINV